ncbi:MAG: hypothetical protein POG24_03985, partial [Acidocella sp.]|nr:hypothetical protein [Acidocella sp.]
MSAPIIRSYPRDSWKWIWSDTLFRCVPFAIAGLVGARFMGGLGGVLDGANSGSIVPTLFSVNTSITILFLIVLGGIGSRRGVIVGAAALRLLDFYLLGKLNEFRQTNPIVTDLHGPLHFLSQPQFDFNQTKFLFYGVILLVMILLRPQGLLPDRR